MKRIVALLMLQIAAFSVFAQTEVEKGLEAITMEAVKGQLEFLASDWTEGRAVGTKGAYLAADYIASMFKVYGIEPAGDEVSTRPSRSERMAGVRPQTYNSYFQHFSLIKYTPGEEQTFSVVSSSPGSESAVNFGYRTDFSVQTGSVGQTVQAPLVFVGYGFTDEEEGYDDLKKVDLKGKIAVLLAGYPGHKDSASTGFEKFAPEGRYAAYYMERDKMENLEKSGAVGIIQIITDYDPTLSWSENSIYDELGGSNEAGKIANPFYSYRMTLPGDSLSSDIPGFIITQRVANEIIKGTGVNYEKFEKNVASTLKPESQILTGKSVAFKTTVNSEVVRARNVVGMIEGENKDEFIVVGGHYDHLGIGNGQIYNGADDNASGTVGVMTVAKAFKETGKKPEKSVIFAAWTGEEKGLWGSRYFVKDAMKNKKNVVLNLNYDMIARDTESDKDKNQAGMTYTKANYVIEETTKKHVENHSINLDISYRASDRPGGGSDHAPFAQEGIPIFYFMAAMHPDYHQPSDELSKINWEKMLDIIRIGFLNTWEFANSDDWKKTKVEPESE